MEHAERRTKGPKALRALSSANLGHTDAFGDTDAHGFRVELKKED
jgi:hypothetical protein